MGLGLSNDPSGEDEITNGSFIQLNITNVPNHSFGLSFKADSVTSGDTVKSLGPIRRECLVWPCFSPDAAAQAAGGLRATIPNRHNRADGFKFLDVTAAPGMYF